MAVKVIVLLVVACTLNVGLSNKLPLNEAYGQQNAPEPEVSPAVAVAVATPVAQMPNQVDSTVAAIQAVNPAIDAQVPIPSAAAQMPNPTGTEQVANPETQAVNPTPSSQVSQRAEKQGEPAKKDGNAVVVTVDNLAKGIGDILGMKPAVKLSDCSAKYSPDTTFNSNLKEVLDVIFTAANISLSENSRGFIDAAKFNFKTTQPDDAAIIISDCDKKSFKIVNFKSESPNSPVEWIEIASTNIEVIEFLYDEMINQDAETAWNAMHIKGDGAMTFGTDDSSQYIINFEKVMYAPDSDKLVDSDMNIRITNNAVDSYEVKATDFVKMFVENVDDILYPPGSGLKFDCITNDELTIEQTSGFNPIVIGYIGESNTYSVYVSGSVKYCPELSSTTVDIICQSEITGGINCALIASIDASTPAKYDEFVNSGLNHIGEISLTDLATKSKLFVGRIPEKFIFQTSRNEIISLNDDLQKKFESFITNEHKRDIEGASQSDIIPKFCFRYRLDNIISKNTNLQNANALVNACPSLGKMKFYLPDIALVPIDQIPLLATTFPEELQYKNMFKEQLMDIAYIEARDSENEVGSYMYTFSLKAPAKNDMRGFAFNAKFPFLLIENSPITITKDIAAGSVLEGVGEEQMLGFIVRFVIEEDETSPIFKIDFDVTNSFFLPEALRDAADVSFTIEEINDKSYVTPFEPLENVTLTSLILQTIPTGNNLRFVGTALLGNESNINFEYYLLQTPENNDRGRSCLSAKDGNLGDFINAVRGKLFLGMSWVRYSKIGMVYLPSVGDRPDCESDICCINGYTPGDNVGLKMQDIQLQHCDGKNEVNQGCKFLYRVFNRSAIDVSMSGFMDVDHIELIGTTTNDMTLGPDIIISGTPPIKIRIATRRVDKFEYMSFKGYMTFPNKPSNILYTKMVVAGDTVILKILSQLEEMAAPDLFTVDFVALTDTQSSRKTICTKGPLKTLELSAHMQIGYNREHLLYFTKKRLMKQFLDPIDGKIFKFYACVPSKTLTPIRDVLKAFNGETVHGLLDGMHIKRLCITFHEGPSNWDIAEVGLNVQPGLRLSGLLISHTRQKKPKHPEGETIHLKLDMDFSVGTTASSLCITMPILSWGVQLREVRKKMQETAMIKMFYSKESTIQGPQYCISLPHQAGGTFHASLSGYIKSFAFEGPSNIVIAPNDPINPGNLFGYTFEYSGKLFREVVGRIKLEAVYAGQDPFLIDFQVTIDQLNLQDLGQQVSEYQRNIHAVATHEETTADEYLQKYVKWHADVSKKVSDIQTKKGKRKTKFSKVKAERARAMQASRKDCSRDCGYVRVPGWKVDDKCIKSSNGKSLRCVNYVEDAHIASNVGCVAQCEAEKVKSFEEAQKLDEIAQADGGDVDRTSECLKIGNSEMKEIKLIADKTKKNHQTMSRIVKPLKCLETLDSTKFKIKNLISVKRVNSMTDANCLKFDWSMEWDDLDRCGFTNQFTGFTNVNRCFNGMFVKNLTEYSVEKGLLTNTMKKLERKSPAASGSYLIWDKIHKKTGGNPTSRKINDLADKFERCMNESKVQMPAGRRSVIDSMTPLYGGAFTIFEQGTVDSFSKRSPWEVASKEDAFKHMSIGERKMLLQNSTIPESESSCAAARRATTDYSDIANYVHKWVKEQSSARRTFSSVKKLLNDEVDQTDKKYVILQSNLSTDAVELMRYWANKAKAGMSQWLTSEEERIRKYNSESLPIIRKELEFVYTDKDHPTLNEFLSRSSSDGSKALKKANIASPDGNTFSDLSKNLLSILVSGKNLEEISTPVEDTIKRIEGLHKRTILCSS